MIVETDTPEPAWALAIAQQRAKLWMGSSARPDTLASKRLALPWAAIYVDRHDYPLAEHCRLARRANPQNLLSIVGDDSDGAEPGSAVCVYALDGCLEGRTSAESSLSPVSRLRRLKMLEQAPGGTTTFVIGAADSLSIEHLREALDLSDAFSPMVVITAVALDLSALDATERSITIWKAGDDEFDAWLETITADERPNHSVELSSCESLPSNGQPPPEIFSSPTSRKALHAVTIVAVIAAIVFTTPGLRSMLFTVEASDLVKYAGVAAFLAGVIAALVVLYRFYLKAFIPIARLLMVTCELMIIFVSVGLITSLFVPQYTYGGPGDPRIFARSQHQTLRSQIQLFRMREDGRWPDFRQGWSQLIDGGYIQAPVENALASAETGRSTIGIGNLVYPAHVGSRYAWYWSTTKENLFVVDGEGYLLDW